MRGVVRPLISRPGDSSRVLMMAVNRGGRELRRGGGPAERPRGRPGGREGPQWLGVRADIRRRGHAAPACRPSPFKGEREKKNPLTHRVRGDKGGARLAGGRSGGRGRDRGGDGGRRQRRREPRRADAAFRRGGRRLGSEVKGLRG